MNILSLFHHTYVSGSVIKGKPSETPCSSAKLINQSVRRPRRVFKGGGGVSWSVRGGKIQTSVCCYRTRPNAISQTIA